MRKTHACSDKAGRVWHRRRHKNHQNPLSRSPGISRRGGPDAMCRGPTGPARGNEAKRKFQKWVIASPSSEPRAMWAGKCSTSSPSGSFRRREVIALASSRSQGQEISFGDKRAQGAEPREFRLHRRRFRADVGRLGRRQGIWRKDRRAPAASWSIIRASGATTPTCRWWCPRSTRTCSTPTWRATIARTSSPTRTARRRSWWWR